MRITYIIGLPGSGKSHLIKELNRTEDNCVIDDPINFVEDVLPFLDGRDLIIADPNLCVPGLRTASKSVILDQLFKKRGVKKEAIKIQYIYFENDPEQCKKNIEYREKNEGCTKNADVSLDILTKIYLMPKDVNPIKVWKNENSSE